MRLLIAAALFTSSLAYADRTPDVRQMHTDDCAAARKSNKTCVLDMGKDDVVGNAPTASGSSVAIIPTTKQPSLIRLRRDFIVEILKTAEDL